VKKAYKKLPVIHVCRDSTAIAAREKAVKKDAKKGKKPAGKRGRPPKTSPKAEKEPPQLKQQISLDAHAVLNNLNCRNDGSCFIGCFEVSALFFYHFRVVLEKAQLLFEYAALSPFFK
jgi:hypothetical protein